MKKKSKTKAKKISRSNPSGKIQRYSLDEIIQLKIRLDKLMEKLIISYDKSDINFVIEKLNNIPYVANQGKFNQFGTYLAMIETGLSSVKSKLDDGQIQYLR